MAFGRALDAILLRRREEHSARRPEDLQQRLQVYRRAAEARLLGARDLHEPRSFAAAITLYRDAAMVLLQAASTAAGKPPPTSVPEAWQQLDPVLPKDAPPHPAGFERARELLSTDDPLRLDAVPVAERDSARLDVERTIRWLRKLVELRPPAEIRRVRWARVAMLSSVPLLGLGALVNTLRAPTNLALGADVDASGRYSRSGPAALVTNGAIESDFGYSTGRVSSPWIRIDLGETRRVHRVEVRGRNDGKRIASMPLVLELSEDGERWERVGRRRDAFTAKKPWSWRGGPYATRWVRVRGSRQKSSISLTEIEVYGRAP